MKLLNWFAICIVCLNLAHAQKVTPTSLSFEAIPPNTSPLEGVALYNPGPDAMPPLIISVSGPFTLADNRCAKGVKPQTHCNVYLTYAPSEIGQRDSGTLTLDYGSGVSTVALGGAGVSGIPTWAKLDRPRNQCDKVQLGDGFAMFAQVGSNDKYYPPPTGESVSISCSLGQDVISVGSVQLKKVRQGFDQTDGVQFVPDQVGTWLCTMTYSGDGVLAPVQATVSLIVGTTYANRKCG
jgi:hypothetical protein